MVQATARVQIMYPHLQGGVRQSIVLFPCLVLVVAGGCAGGLLVTRPCLRPGKAAGGAEVLVPALAPALGWAGPGWAAAGAVGCPDGRAVATFSQRATIAPGGLWSGGAPSGTSPPTVTSQVHPLATGAETKRR